jgi:hypothetical protein
MGSGIEAPTFDRNEAGEHFYRLLGELHYSYTALEHELACLVFIAVTKLGKQPDAAILAMLGGQRMNPLKDTIKRLLRVTGANADRINFVSVIFSHLGEIQFFRDQLTHYLTVISDYNPECWINMNYTGIRERDKMEDLHFNLYALHAASNDLQVMRQILGPIFNYRVIGTDLTIPVIPSWLFEPTMLVRDRPISRTKTKNG